MCCNAAGLLGFLSELLGNRKEFLFEKKHQKTFINLGPGA
jgi:hypothetical protein